eukprot:9470441-Pyramimonas_sp.AAC.1
MDLDGVPTASRWCCAAVGRAKLGQMLSPPRPPPVGWRAGVPIVFRWCRAIGTAGPLPPGRLARSPAAASRSYSSCSRPTSGQRGTLFTGSTTARRWRVPVLDCRDRGEGYQSLECTAKTDARCSGACWIILGQEWPATSSWKSLGPRKGPPPNAAQPH